MSQGGILRKAALERLSSPERLDELLTVTSPTGWVALTAVGAGLVAVIIWSIFGSISIKVYGQGVLIRGGAVLDVTAGWKGRIESIEVSPGDVIREGQPVAKVAQTDLLLKLANKRQELFNLRQKSKADEASAKMLIAQYQADLRSLKQQIKKKEDLVRRGLSTQSEVNSLRQRLTPLQRNIADLQEKLRGAGPQIDRLKGEIAELEQQLASRSTVNSPFGGRVLEVAVRRGDLISPGMRLVTLENTEAPIKAAVYIPAGDGKKVAVRMKGENGKTRSVKAFVSPSTAKSEEYGYILGEVEYVSDFPLTKEALVQTLRNEALAEQLAGKGAPIEVRIALIKDDDPENKSGFKWTSGRGPDFEIYSGTLCSANVEVETKRPISYVLPILKSMVGAE